MRQAKVIGQGSEFIPGDLVRASAGLLLTPVAVSVVIVVTIETEPDFELYGVCMFHICTAASRKLKDFTSLYCTYVEQFNQKLAVLFYTYI